MHSINGKPLFAALLLTMLTGKPIDFASPGIATPLHPLQKPIETVRNMTAGDTKKTGQSWTQYGGANRDFFVSPLSRKAERRSGILWKRKLGQGTSGIVSDGKSLFTLYAEPDPMDAKKQIEVVIALDKTTGQTQWEHRHSIKMLNKQESFTGDPPRPQATPALLAGRVCTLGFTGLLQCFDTANGQIVWEHNLVSEFGATPVQFGFSSSPLILQNNFVVHIGGKQTALAAFSAATGKVVWKSEPAEPSYASPILIQVAGEMQIVQVTRDAILGISAQDGATLWSYPMPSLGLTNVPTPIALPGQKLLISGQGVLGTHLLELSTEESKTKVEAVWKNTRTPFFYCNWAADTEAVYGSVGSFTVGLNLATGEEVWKERGQTDANLLRVGKEVVLLRGDGLLTRCSLSSTGLQSLGSFQILSGRCWTAPTLLSDVLYVRDDKDIAAVGLASLTQKP